MALKTIEYTVTSEGITPKTEQSGGTQGEHNVTEVVMTLGAGVPTGDDVRYRVQTIDGAGGFYSTEFLTPSDGKITFLLSRDITLAGGVAYLYLVATKVVYEGEKFVSESQEFLSKAMRLRFENTGVGSPSEEAYRRGITGALLSVQQSAEQAEDAKEGAETAKSGAETAKSDAERFASNASDYAAEAKNFSELAGLAKQSAISNAENAKEFADMASGEREKAEQNATKAAKAQSIAEIAAGDAAQKVQTTLGLVETHNNSQNLDTHRDIRQLIRNAESIAKGKARSLVFDTEAQLKSWVFGHGKNFVDPNNFVTIPTEPFDDEFNPQGTVNVYNDGQLFIGGRANSDQLVSGTIQLPAGTFNLHIDFATFNGFSQALLKIGDTITNLDYRWEIEETSDVYYIDHIFTLTESAEVVLEITCVAQASIGAYIQIEEGEQYTGFEPFAGPYVRADGKTPADLQIGDNLYVVELGVPDYWWDGQTAQELGAEKPDFSELVSKEELAAQFGGVAMKSMTQSQYDAAYLAGTLDAGTIYFVYEDDIV